MSIQSLSVCVPAKRCINDCKFCCSKMHTADYEDRFGDAKHYAHYSEDLRKRLEYARENGCNTCMLTGNNEPQQNREFLRVFSEVNRSLRMPFLNIEMQTTGAFIDGPFLDFFKNAVGLTTCAVSVACLDDDRRNREITGTRDEKLSLSVFCREVKNRNINLRLCLNMNDEMLLHHDYSPESIAALCGELGADQITFRALWSPGSDTPQGEWIDQHVTDRTLNCIEMLKEDIRRNGRYLDTLEYGSDRYDYHGFSVVIDEDCMSQENRKDAIKYLILRPTGHLYTKWDSAASLVF